MSDVLDRLKKITDGNSSSDSSDEFDLEDFTRGFTGTANTGTSYQPNFGTTTYADDNYSNEGRNYQTQESTRDSPVNITTDIGIGAREQVPISDVQVGGDFLSMLKGLPKGVTDFAKENPEFWKLLLGGIGAYLGATQDVPKATGGGYAKRYVGPKTQLTRTIEQGPYGPIARHSQMPVTAAAMGGIMHAYANGGQVKPFPMQDGGFVMTKRAVDGAGGPQGIRSLLPETRMIGGPPDPTGRKDRTPAYIQGPNGRTPARVSNGEAYVPPGRDTRHLYALMRALERKA